MILGAALATRLVMTRALKLQDTGCFGGFVVLIAVVAGLFLLVRGTVVLVRLVARRTSLRLAFSYFLIGIVPIPLLAALLLLGNYIEAHQFMATRVRREVTALGEAALAKGSLPRVAADPSGRVTASDVAWLRAGQEAPWVGTIARPAFLGVNGEVWLAVPEPGRRAARVLRLDDPAGPWLQELADRTGYEVAASLETSTRSEKGIRITTEDDRKKERAARGAADAPSRRPAGAPPPGRGIWNGEWIHAFYLETVANAPADRDAEQEVVILKALSSPHNVEEQLFTQGVKDIARTARAAFLGLAGLLLIVYLAAVAVAFVLVGSIARNVNRLTRAAQAVSRGDYSVRIHSRSRDQIGDLARSFDQMTASIEQSVSDRVRQQKVDAEIAMAATIQQKLLPPREATLPGFTVHAHSNPAAEIGGDYYDYMEAPGGRNIAALGDVSGHGLPTGLLVGMAKAGIATLVEADYRDGELFARLNELIVRSTDPRHYMTLGLIDYDPATRRGRLTNAGQLAPYRISAGKVTALELPAFPLGIFAGKTYPTSEHAFESGDRLVFFSDGLVEAVDVHDEPFGFQRFEEVLLGHTGADAPSIRDAILAAVRAHAGEHEFDDDCTLMVLTFA